MLKAVAITKFDSAFGELTVVVTEENEIYFRAHEAARLFGFSDTKGCLRQHVKKSELVLMPTTGGQQPVKCIPWHGVIHIGFKSRLKGKEDLLFELSHFHKCVKIDTLEKKNELQMNYLRRAQELLDKYSTVAEELLALVDECMEVIKELNAEKQTSMNR